MCSFAALTHVSSPVEVDEPQNYQVQVWAAESELIFRELIILCSLWGVKIGGPILLHINT